MSWSQRLWKPALWKTWWEGLTAFERWSPLVALFVYWGILVWLGGLRFDLVVPTVAGVVLYYLGPQYRSLYHFLLPLVLITVVYDSMRYYADLIRGPIHVKEPYLWEKAVFGISTPEGVLTPNEWWQKHTHPVLDFFTGLSYILFIPVYVGTAAYFRFWLSRRGTAICHPNSIEVRSSQMMWAFFWVNMLGYSTYYWYAASPPWYVELYGLGPARLDVPPNVAGCARFDELIGIPIFREWYGKSADVHGAIPSLHVAYPLMASYYAFRFGALRVFSVGFFLLVSFAAVYLNHHYILDVIWGAAYALIVSFSMDAYWNYRLKQKGVIVPAPEPA